MTDSQDSDQRIVNWLFTIQNSLPTDPSPPPGPSSKKDALEDITYKHPAKRLLSPPMTEDGGSLSKRPRPDPNATPRRTLPSGNSSPTKRGISAMRMDGLITHPSFDGSEPLPDALDNIVQDIKRDSGGFDIMTAADKIEFEKRASAGGNHVHLFQKALKPDPVDKSGVREALGRLPPVDALVETWQKAERCQNHSHSEAGWNCAVHYPLMELALKYANVTTHATADVTANQEEILIDVINATTAQISPMYAPNTLAMQHKKRVDFCFMVESIEKTKAATCLSDKSLLSPNDSVNHTDFVPLRACPISVSIETKLTGEEWQSAMAQQTVWLSAHWNCLDRLTGDSKVARDELCFLPAIIVQGHDWTFLAATRGEMIEGRNDRQTIIWNKIGFGSTTGLKGICQIIKVLQRLALWSQRTYWPWFRKYAMNNLEG
ncbi:hypothetical protein FOC4_g10000314 [Fusarium odoratissimum]|uniref:PD-(D/E)XK nuclease-like domain-containing protein n=1 Tax=Fusarium oxysporum f. sp. cubense (strain race 4) TaxID=2502994 RepID=N1S2H8_FUSC4|nr:hypothetical protein FOC4_g10000314 [Fusarium odoratissimum]